MQKNTMETSCEQPGSLPLNAKDEYKRIPWTEHWEQLVLSKIRTNINCYLQSESESENFCNTWSEKKAYTLQYLHVILNISRKMSNVFYKIMWLFTRKEIKWYWNNPYGILLIFDPPSVSSLNRHHYRTSHITSKFAITGSVHRGHAHTN